MPRSLHTLSHASVKSLSKPGRYSDGGGLYLQIRETGTKSWVFAWKEGGKRTVMGLGPWPAVSLADARKKAEECRKHRAAGLDPLKESRKEQTPTFRDAVAMFLDDDRLNTWKNAKHRAQWQMTLGKAYCSTILDLSVDQVGRDEVLLVLKPIWLAKAETAKRIMGRIERVLAFAEAKGWRPEGKNPAQWKNGLDAILTKRVKLTRGHHRALPFADIPAFMASLKQRTGTAALALEFLILTAARSGEAVGARWDEIDFERKLWTVPAVRMKAGKPHTVPLSLRALEILEHMARNRSGEFVFPGQIQAKASTGGIGAATKRQRKPVSAASMEMLLRRMDVKGIATIHGFRSSFRDWAGDHTEFPREVAEQALAHTIGGTEGAYRRGTAIEKRRRLMDAWADYCGGAEAGGKVIKLAI